jgi:TPR repeat protein
MYHEGWGVPQNYAEAVKWYRTAAEQGDASAQNNLGYMYLNGLGVPQNYVLAYFWFSLAVPLPSAHENFDLVRQRMTPAEIAEAERLTREWKRTSE